MPEAGGGRGEAPDSNSRESNRKADGQIRHYPEEPGWAARGRGQTHFFNNKVGNIKWNFSEIQKYCTIVFLNFMSSYAHFCKNKFVFCVKFR